VHIPFHIDVAPSKGAKEYPVCERGKKGGGWIGTMTFSFRSFGAVFGKFAIFLGIVGYGLGVIFMQPYWLATGHAMLYGLSPMGIVMGPVFVISGTLWYIVSHRSEHPLEKVRQ
jgi:hypothetical protein